MRILITGGMGFIGKAVVESMLKHDIDSIYILDNLSKKIHGREPSLFNFEDKRVRIFKGDVSIRGDLEPLLCDSDLVLHLAAETGTGQSMYEIELYSRVNISSVALMLDILRNKKHRVKKIVLASSRAVYGEGKYKCSRHGVVYPFLRESKDMQKNDFDVKCPECGRACIVLPSSEDSLMRPVSFYGLTKQVQESMIMTLSPHIGIAPVVLRYQNVYGPGQSLLNPYTGILSVFSTRIRMNRNIEVFEDGKESRDFVYIDDVAEVTSKVLFLGKADGGTFNVGSGVRTTVLDLAQKLKKCFKSDVEVVINGKYRAGDIRHNYADRTKAKEILNFSPKVELGQGIEEFVAWVKRQENFSDLYQESMNELRQKGLFK